MKSHAIFPLLLLCVILNGCNADVLTSIRPHKATKTDIDEFDPQFGKILKELPTLVDAEKPFDFPYSEDIDHSKYADEFKKDQDFF